MRDRVAHIAPERARRATHADVDVPRTLIDVEAEVGEEVAAAGDNPRPTEGTSDDVRTGQHEVTPDGRKILAEQLLGDHHALDLVGALVDLGGPPQPSSRCCSVPLSWDDSPDRGGS